MTAPETRGSTSPTWMNCPESAWYRPLYPNNSSPASLEGQAAHEMTELVLTGQFSIDEIVDRQAKNGTMMTGDMVEHAQMYIDHVLSHGVGYWVEESIIIPVFHDLKPVTGTCDGAGFGFDETTGTLYIDDFKYGFRLVEVFENWQLLICAIGIVNKITLNGGVVNKIIMTIIQPRGFHHDGPIRTWTISAEELIDYTQQLRQGVERVHSSDRYFKTGSWCRNCEVLADCQAAKSARMNAIDVIENALPDTDTPAQVANLLELLKRASDTVKINQDAIIARAESMILGGQPIPGYGYEPGKGKTRFIDEKEAIATAACFGVDITESKIVTPAESKRRGLPDAVYAGLITVPSTAPRLVKRDASTLADKVFKS